MTPKLEAALRQALEFIEANTYGGDDVVQLMTTIREELAEQPAQEPVAWINTTGDFLFQHPEEHGRENEEWFPLVHQNTSPPANTNAGKPWVGLTDEEWQEIDASLNGKRDLARIFTRAIEAKLKEKNHG